MTYEQYEQYLLLAWYMSNDQQKSISAWSNIPVTWQKFDDVDNDTFDDADGYDNVLYDDIDLKGEPEDDFDCIAAIGDDPGGISNWYH